METVFFLGCLGFEEANVHLITLYHLLFTLKVLVRLIEQNQKGPNVRGPSGCLILSEKKKRCKNLFSTACKDALRAFKRRSHARPIENNIIFRGGI